MEDTRNELNAPNPVPANGLAPDVAGSTPEPTGPTKAEENGETPATPAAGAGESGQASAKAPVSAKKLDANRKNAQKSSGPKTEAGKARSSANSYKHGFFAKRMFQTPQQAAADGADYGAMVKGVIAHYQPVGFMECLWAEKIAIEFLRLARVVAYEQKVMDRWSYPYEGPAAPNILRFQMAGNRLLNQAIEELERLQAKRRAHEVPQEPVPMPVDTAAGPGEPSEQPDPTEEEEVDAELRNPAGAVAEREQVQPTDLGLESSLDEICGTNPPPNTDGEPAASPAGKATGEPERPNEASLPGPGPLIKSAETKPSTPLTNLLTRMIGEEPAP